MVKARSDYTVCRSDWCKKAGRPEGAVVHLTYFEKGLRHLQHAASESDASATPQCHSDVFFKCLTTKRMRCANRQYFFRRQLISMLLLLLLLLVLLLLLLMLEKVRLLISARPFYALLVADCFKCNKLVVTSCVYRSRWCQTVNQCCSFFEPKIKECRFCYLLLSS